MIILYHWTPAWPSPSLAEVFPCGSCKPQYSGLLSYKRIYEIKEEKENGEGIEKYIKMRNSWSWYLHSGMPPLSCYVDLIVGHIYNMLLLIDVYCLFSLLMTRLWWPCYNAWSVIIC